MSFLRSVVDTETDPIDFTVAPYLCFDPAQADADNYRFDVQHPEVPISRTGRCCSLFRPMNVLANAAIVVVLCSAKFPYAIKEFVVRMLFWFRMQ